MPINHRAIAVNEYGKLVEDGRDYLAERIVRGYLAIWGKKNKHNERWHKGAFAKSIQERGPGSNSNYKIKFLNNHRGDDPLALFDVLKEDQTGLYFETKPLDDVPSADRVLKQIRSGTLNNFSNGFNFVWDKMEWNEREQLIDMYEGELYEGSVVGVPSDMSTFAMRSLECIEELTDDADYFINQLPRKFQLEARNIIARHKSLIVNGEPFEQRKKTLNSNEPTTEAGLDLNYLFNNLKLH